jgi:hypothetical protein
MKTMRFALVVILLCPLLFVTGCGESQDAVGVGDDGGPCCESSTEGPSVVLVDMSDCKDMPTGIPTVSASFDQDCLEYWYVGGNVLGLRHVNAGFNCCPTIDTHIHVVGDTITIEEIEIEGLCACLCLFDVEYEIQGLPPAVYHVVVLEPYRPDTDPVLEFTMDLTSSSSGRYCVERSEYPWGYPW